MKANMGKSLLSPLLTLVLFLFTIAVNAAPTVARDAQLPIEVQIATDGVSIQSIEDVVIIKDVKANRGNATLLYPFLIGRDPLFPRTLKFGESLVGVSPIHAVREVEVQTDKGSWIFTVK